MPPRSVLVTYTLHPTPPPNIASYSVHSPLLTALEGIRSQFPLTNLHWKPTSRNSIRTIQSVDVNLVELGEVGTLGKEVAGSVLEWPLVNICLISCESDEVYKNQTKSFIRDWLSLLAARRNVHTPLIVLVNTASAAAAASAKNVFGRDKGVIAKLKADFNTTKRDKCVQLNLPPEGRGDPAAWVEVMNKLKESIVTALDGAMLEREEDVKRGEAQRVTVGWNFCTWFLLKESLAHSFEGVNLHEDALIVYEELEAAFLQVVKEQNLSWFGKLGATGPKDDSLPILDTTVRPYRDLLQSSSISIFEFRIYVFARQAQLLGKLGRITEIAKRGQWFVASLARRLRESEADLAENFIESWTYTACSDIVQKCDEWSQIDRPNGDYSGLIAYESARSELLDIARVQVERIGISAGHLPDQYPFSQASTPALVNDDVLFESSDNGLSDTSDEHAPVQRQALSNPQLLDAVADGNNFRALYTTLTRRAIVAYDSCNKANSIIRLKADLAALALLKNDWKASYDLCRGLAKDCAELHMWEPASRFALGGALKSHDRLKLYKEGDWTNLALAYLRICSILQDDEANVELANVIRGLQSVEEAQTVEGHRAFDVRIVGDTASWGTSSDVTTVQFEVTSRLQSDLALDSIQLVFAEDPAEGISFAVDGVTLRPGTNTLTAVCNTSCQGLFALREARLHLGKIVFAYPSEQSGTSLRIHRNPAGPRTVLRMPHAIALDQDPAVVLEVRAGEVDLKDAKVVLVSSQNDVEYSIHKAECSDTAIKPSKAEIELGDVKSGQAINISIPYTGSSASELANARAVLRYTTSSGEERTAIDLQSLSMGLPLTVNVQDFFRPQCLVSHFTIASDGREYLRIKSVKLDEGQQEGYEVESARKEWDTNTVVSPAQSLSCLFKVRKKTSDTDATAVLRLVIQYRGIDEEVQALCTNASGSSRKLSRASHKVMKDKAIWLQEYLASGKLDDAFKEGLRRELPSTSPKELEGFLKALAANTSEDDKGFWRTLEIPVDVPQRRLLTAVRFNHTFPPGSIYEGRAILLSMEFNTSFSWLGALDSGSRDDIASGKAELVWDVAVSQDDWVVLGRKKGQYIAEADKPTTQELVLVPVRPGRLFLPAVHVQLVPTATSSDNPTSGASTATAKTHEQEADGGVICETFVVNAGEVVDVLPAGKSRTVLVPIQQREGWDM